MVLLLLQKLVLHFVVIPKEDHLPIDERLEGMSLEGHIHKQNEVVEHLLVARGEIKLSPL